MRNVKINKKLSKNMLSMVDRIGAEVLINNSVDEITKDKYLVASFKIRLLLLRIIQFIESKKEIHKQDIDQLNVYLNDYLNMGVVILK